MLGVGKRLLLLLLAASTYELPAATAAAEAAADRVRAVGCLEGSIMSDRVVVQEGIRRRDTDASPDLHGRRDGWADELRKAERASDMTTEARLPPRSGVWGQILPMFAVFATRHLGAPRYKAREMIS
ncbi:hypothetical protein IWZ03DRAFT_361162 [Phyllosticta citriasiana]|uniref:Secreted protein n=1 Tax=Phyllosticta citriasiana TaxID=595635 RepID=A0ABR1KGV9_9PEZI